MPTKHNHFATFTREPDNGVKLKRLAVITNPASGGKRGIKVLAKVRPVLEEVGYTVKVQYTDYAGHARDLGRTMDLSEVDCLVAAGGDGTVHEIINGFLARAEDDEARSRVVLAVIPCGSGNTFAFDLGISSVREAVAQLTSGTVRSVDVAKVTRWSSVEEDAERSMRGVTALELPKKASKLATQGTSAHGTQLATDNPLAAKAASAETTATTAAATTTTSRARRTGATSTSTTTTTTATATDAEATTAADLYPTTCFSINIIGWGLPAALLRDANGLRWCGSAQYNVAAYMSLLRNVGYRGAIRMVDEHDQEVVVSGTFIMAQAQVTVHMGEKLAFCPQAKMDDGLLDLVIVRHASRFALVSLMESAKRGGKHVAHNIVEYYRCKSLTLVPDHAEPFVGENTANIDGELVGFTPLKADVLPGALRFVTGHTGPDSNASPSQEPAQARAIQFGPTDMAHRSITDRSSSALLRSARRMSSRSLRKV